jgi:iron uptake system component EfeO
MSTPRKRTVPAVLGLTSAALVLAACGGGSGSGSASVSGAKASAISVSATDSACEVADLKLESGTHKFMVTNKGSKVTEFEILAAGDRIVGELENIAPGVARPLQVQLDAGDYQAACRPNMVGAGVRHALTVTGATAGTSDDQQLTAAVTSYTQYVQQQVSALQDQTRQFTDAVKARDVAKAQQLYPTTRAYYERIEPVAESFGDLDPEIDARENDVADGDTWTGFHVLEKTLWTGGDLTAAGPVADGLVTDVDELAAKTKDLQLKPLDLANGALGLLDEIATSKVTGEEDRYSHTDLSDFSANLEGSQQAVQSLRPVIAERKPELATALDQQFTAARAALEKYRQGDGFVPYTDLTPDQTRGLSDAINALAAQVSQVPEVVAGK